MNADYMSFLWPLDRVKVPLYPAHRYVFADDLNEIDKALEFVRGHVGAAAKLLDFPPKRLSNLINYHLCLKSKWGGRERRRQKDLGFRLLPHPADSSREIWQQLDLDREIVSKLRLVSRTALMNWLDDQIRLGREQIFKGNTPSSVQAQPQAAAARTISASEFSI